jgi:hypothetical protein
VSGEIDQGAGMLSEDTIEKGYTLLCVASPKSDAVIDCIEEVCLRHALTVDEFPPLSDSVTLFNVK